MIRGAYVALAKQLGSVLHESGLDDRLARREGRWALWVRSVPAIHDLEALIGLDLPWWTFRAIEAVEEHLRSLEGGARVFEFGSGASTVWLARRAAQVYSVEHDSDFAGRLQAHLDPDVVQLRVVSAEKVDNPAIPSGRPSEAGRDFVSYVDQIDDVEGSFDLVVIDGRAREQCLRRALPRLRPGGLALFDDAWRPRYRAALALPDLSVRRTYGLTPCLPYPSCTALIRPAG